MVSEKTIEKVIAQVESGEVDFEKAIRELTGRQPAVVSFLLTDHEGALTSAEQELLLYLATIIFKSVEAEDPDLPQALPDEVADAEEANWDRLGQSKARSFRERLDVFFAKTEQEDLLAFIEDSLTAGDEDEDELTATPEGREPMFVLLKTVVDVLTAV